MTAIEMDDLSKRVKVETPEAPSAETSSEAVLDGVSAYWAWSTASLSVNRLYPYLNVDIYGQLG
jgi:hypothetical protein